MRDLLVLLIFAYGMVKALKVPAYGSMLWVWIGLMNPHRLGWGFAYNMPLAMISAALIVVSAAAHSKDMRSPASAPVTVLCIFILWTGITALTAIHQAESIANFIEVLKVLLMVIVVAATLRTRNQITGMVGVTAMSIGYFGAKGGLFTLMTGGSFRVWGPPLSVVEGNNELAVALVITIPMLYFLAQEAERVATLPALRFLGKKRIAQILYVMMGFCAVAAIGSHSRGALLSIAAMSSVFWWRSKSKATLGIALIVLAPAMLFFMPDEWTSRMSTIKTYDQDESAMGRINAWTMALHIANDRIFGAGFLTATPEVYQMYAPSSNFILVAHSVYFQVLGQHGYIGLFLYLLFWALTYRTAGRLVTLTANRADLAWAGLLGNMVKTSLIGFAVGGAFLSLAFWDMPYYFMAIVVMTEKLVRKTLAEGINAASSAEPARANAPASAEAGRLSHVASS